MPGNERLPLRRCRGRGGLSLIELLAAVFILLILAGALSQVLRSTLLSGDAVTREQDLLRSATFAMDRVALFAANADTISVTGQALVVEERALDTYNNASHAFAAAGDGVPDADNDSDGRINVGTNDPPEYVVFQLNTNVPGNWALMETDPNYATATTTDSTPAVALCERVTNFTCRALGPQAVEISLGLCNGDAAVNLRRRVAAKSLPVSRRLATSPVLGGWLTFLGGSGQDYGYAVTADAGGNVYVAGASSATWGSPVRNFSTGDDAFVAKLDINGGLRWVTFLGGSGSSDAARGIAVDGSGNVYVVGQSNSSWGSPVRAKSTLMDTFVAKLSGTGSLTWSTFLGGVGNDYGYGIAVDAAGNTYVCGNSAVTWGLPVRGFTVSLSADAFVAKLNGNGTLLWNTFLGGLGSDGCKGIALDTVSNVYVGGYSSVSWGSPLHSFDSSFDMFAAKLANNGSLSWSTFAGGDGYEAADALALDGSSNLYLTGECDTTWGSPVNAFGGGAYDASVVMLNGSGALVWNTFLGGLAEDLGNDVAVDRSGNVCVAGRSYATWGAPVHAFAGDYEGFAAGLSVGGGQSWSTFLGSAAADGAMSCALDDSGNAYGAGYSSGSWGTPIRPYSAGADAFVVKNGAAP